jgi:nucleotide-binding universal stress UspA family protein
MQEKVLVPLDGSKVGEAALPVIERLMTKLSPEIKLEITLFGVITLLRHWVVVGEASAPVSYTEEELRLIKQRVIDYLEKTGETLRSKGAIVSTRVSTGHAAEEILKAVDEINADMIAMSTHGRSGLRRLAFGSTTDKILRGASVPVLLVRAPTGTVNE